MTDNSKRTGAAIEVYIPSESLLMAHAQTDAIPARRSFFIGYNPDN